MVPGTSRGSLPVEPPHRACQVVLSPVHVDTASIDASNAVEHRDIAAEVVEISILHVESSTT